VDLVNSGSAGRLGALLSSLSSYSTPRHLSVLRGLVPFSIRRRPVTQKRLDRKYHLAATLTLSCFASGSPFSIAFRQPEGCLDSARLDTGPDHRLDFKRRSRRIAEFRGATRAPCEGCGSERAGLWSPQLRAVQTTPLPASQARLTAGSTFAFGSPYFRHLSPVRLAKARRLCAARFGSPNLSSAAPLARPLSVRYTDGFSLLSQSV
jgi:hypothetical protein